MKQEETRIAESFLHGGSLWHSLLICYILTFLPRLRLHLPPDGALSPLSHSFLPQTWLEAKQCKPVAANRSLPTRRCQPVDANQSLQTSRCKPVDANRSLQTRRCKPVDASHAMRIKRREPGCRRGMTQVVAYCGVEIGGICRKFSYSVLPAYRSII